MSTSAVFSANPTLWHVPAGRASGDTQASGSLGGEQGLPGKAYFSWSAWIARTRIMARGKWEGAE